jgi:hypothetical protein
MRVPQHRAPHHPPQPPATFPALQEVPAAGGKWQAAFAEVARICGFSNFTGRESDVSAVIQVVQNLKTSEAELKVGGSRRKHGAVLHAIENTTVMLRTSWPQRGLRTLAARMLPVALLMAPDMSDSPLQA